jgi:hypothetical protein
MYEWDRRFAKILSAEGKLAGIQDSAITARAILHHELFFPDTFFFPFSSHLLTETFNLKADPYEMNNLATNAAQKQFRAELESEFDVQAKKVDFRIPDYADKPGDAVPGKKAGRKAAKAKKNAVDN